jgi:chemotaxis protein CheD
MNLADSPLPLVHLNPGELLVTREPKWVVTLLGSCIAVTMFSPRFRLAAMCHAMLPRPRSHEFVAKNDPNQFRFLSHALPAMLEHFCHAGIQVEEIEVKMFGGGNVIHFDETATEDSWIGTANIQTARELLRETPLTLRAENVGGSVGSKILFNTQDGKVLHKHLGDPVEFGKKDRSVHRARLRNRKKAFA